MMLRARRFGLILMVGFGVFIGAAIFGGAEAARTVMMAPLVALGFILKMVMFLLLIGLVVRMMARAGTGDRPGTCWSTSSNDQWADKARPYHQSRGRSSEDDEVESRTERFEEWHRMAHARQEVDTHTPPFDE